MRYKIKKPIYVLKASKKNLVDADPTIFYKAGDEVNGGEYYIVLGKGMRRVIKLAQNRYIPFETVDVPENKSGLILPPTFFTGQLEQGGYSYLVPNRRPTNNFTGIVPPNNLAIDWADKNTIYYSQEGETKVVELTPEQAMEQHKSSGSKKPFKEWIKGDEGKGWLISFGNSLADILSTGSIPVGSGGATPPPAKKDDKPETKILGMHPVTFAIVSLGTIGLVGLAVFATRTAGAKK